MAYFITVQYTTVQYTTVMKCIEDECCGWTTLHEGDRWKPRPEWEVFYCTVVLSTEIKVLYSTVQDVEVLNCIVQYSTGQRGIVLYSEVQ